MAGVDQFVAGRRGLGEDAEPGEGVDALEDAHRRGRHGGAADAVEPVGAGDDVALQDVIGAIVAEVDAGVWGIDAGDRLSGGIEIERQVGV